MGSGVAPLCLSRRVCSRGPLDGRGVLGHRPRTLASLHGARACAVSRPQCARPVVRAAEERALARAWWWGGISGLVAQLVRVRALVVRIPLERPLGDDAAVDVDVLEQPLAVARELLSGER